MINFRITLVIIILCFSEIQSQNSNDSIFNKIDTHRKNKDYDNYRSLSKLVKENGRKKNDTVTILRGHRNLLQYYSHFKKNRDSLAVYYNEGIKLSQKYENDYYYYNYKFIWATNLTLEGEYDKALAIFQELEPIVLRNNYDFLPFFYDAFARLHFYLENYETAFNYLKMESKIFEARKAPDKISGVYNNLGILYKSQNQKDSAIFYHEKSLKINLEQKDTTSIIMSYNNIGLTYDHFESNTKALEYYKKAFNYDPNKATSGLINSYVNGLINNKEYKRAEKLLLKAKNNTASKEQLIAVLDKLVLLYKTQKRYDAALGYQEEILIIKEELLDETKVKEIQRLKIKYESEKKEREIAELMSLNKAQQTIINQNRLLVVIVLIVLLLSVVIFLLYLRNKSNANKINRLQLQQRLLYSQMNPHFIFNALSNIQTSILKNDNLKAVNYLIKFSKLLRHNLENSNLNIVTLSEEIKSLKDYLELQKLRLNLILEYKITLEETIEEDLTKIQAMLLQPIVENAIEHGIDAVESPMISIQFVDKKKYLQCIIEDNGIGYTSTLKQKKPEKTSMASNIIKQRLEIMSKKTKQNLKYTIKDKVEQGKIVGTIATIDLAILE